MNGANGGLWRLFQEQKLTEVVWLALVPETHSLAIGTNLLYDTHINYIIH